MNLRNQKNVAHLFVCASVNATQSGVVTSASSLATGEVAFLDLNNTPIYNASAAIAAGQTFRVAYSDGTTLHYSPWVNKSNVISKGYKAYAADQQQVTYLGYVGSGTGNIEAIDQNEYILRILIEGVSAQFGNKQMYKFGAYKTGASATSAEVAIGLVDNLVYNFKREPLKQIQFDAICNTALDTGYDITHDVTVVNGENFFDVASDLTYNTSAGTLVVGDFVRIAATVTAPALTSAVYKVTKIDTLRVWVDRPITSASGTYTDSADSTQVIPSATGLAATWGIKCTGITPSNFKAGVFDDAVVSFKLEPSNMGSTTVTYSTAAVKGTGTRRAVRELEWFLQGNAGNKYRVDVPPATMYDSTTAESYGMYTVKFNTGSTTDSITGTTPTSTIELIFAIDDSSGAVTTAGKNVYDTLAAL